MIDITLDKLTFTKSKDLEHYIIKVKSDGVDGYWKMTKPSIINLEQLQVITCEESNTDTIIVTESYIIMHISGHVLRIHCSYDDFMEAMNVSLLLGTNNNEDKL